MLVEEPGARAVRAPHRSRSICGHLVGLVFRIPEPFYLPHGSPGMVRSGAASVYSSRLLQAGLDAGLQAGSGIPLGARPHWAGGLVLLLTSRPLRVPEVNNQTRGMGTGILGWVGVE